MRKLSKFLLYSIIYLVVSVASAYGVITVSMNNFNKAQNNTGTGGTDNTEEEVVVPEEISAMFEKFTSSPAISLDLSAFVEYNQSQIELDVATQVDLSNGIENIGVQGNINVEYNQQVLGLGITYQNGNLFFDILNGKFFISTNNLMDTINEVLTLFNVEMPDLGIDFEEFDLNSIMGLFSEFEKIENGDSVTLRVSLPVVESIDLICDKDYSLIGIALPRITIEDSIAIEVNATIDYPSELIIPEKNEESYIDLTNITGLINDFVNLLNQDNFGATFNVNVGEIALTGKIDLSILDKSAKINLNIKDQSVNLYLIDSTLYLEYNNLFFKYSLNEIDELLNILNQYLDLNLPVDLIDKLLNAIQSGDFSAIVGEIDLRNFDLSSIDLSILENIVKDGDNTIITLKDIGDIVLQSKEDNITGISFNGGINFQLQFVEFKNIALSNDVSDYIDLASLLPTIENALEILQNNTLSGQINLQYNDLQFDIDYKICKGEELYINLTTIVLGQQISIDVVGDKVYMTLSDSKIMTSFDKLPDTLNKILKHFNIENVDSSDLIEKIKEILNPQINPKLITNFSADENGISITILDKIVFNIENSSNQIAINFNYDNINVSMNLIGSNQEISIPTFNDEEYTTLDSLVDVVLNVYDYVIANKFYFSFNAKYQEFNIIGALNYENNALALTATLEYAGLNINIMYYENKIYITAENIKVVFDINDMDLVKEFLLSNFNLDVDKMLDELLSKLGQNNQETPGEATEGTSQNEFDINKILDIIKDTRIEITQNYIKISALDGLEIVATIENNMLSGASLSFNDIYADIAIESKPLIFAPSGDYVDVAKLLNIAQIAIDYFKDKQVDLDAEILMGESIINASMQLDLTSTLKLSAIINSPNMENMNISANIEDGMFYIDFNGLCLKIDNQNIAELIYIVLEVFGIDANSIPFLKDIDLDLDFSQIETELKGISIEDVVEIVKMVKKIETKGNDFIITIDGAKMNNDENANDIIISLNCDNNTLNTLSISNFVIEGQTMQININFNQMGEFVGVDQTKNYIDISGANELVKALINMTTGTDFHVKGSLDILGSLAGIDISWNVPYEMFIKVVGKGDIELYGVIGEIPTMIGVNNDVPYEFGDTESGSDRYLYIYYKAGYIYLYRSEKVDIMFGTSTRTYEKSTKISIDSFLADPMYYVQYCFGFTDTIMNAIKESMDNPRTEPIDYGNIIKSFTVQDNTNYSLSLNMAEITNSPELDSMDITLGLSQDNSGKNYIQRLGLSLYMPLADIFTLTLSTNDTQIVDYGKTVDMQALYDFINSYKYDAESEWEASNGNWSMSKDIKYTINFVTNSDQVLESQSYRYKDTLTLPSLESYVIDDGKTQKSYSFVSWHTDESLSDESIFNSTTMPRKDVTLYAKWNVASLAYHTISFVSFSEEAFENIYKLEGQEITLPSLNKKVETIDNTTTTYYFDGWYTSEDFTEEFTLNYMPSYDITLYAKWNVEKVEKTRLLTIYDNDEVIYSQRVQVGSAIDLSGLKQINSETKYYLDSSYSTEYTGNFVMEDKDLTLHIRNKYTIIVNSQYGNTASVEYTLYQGEVITLPSQESYVIDDGTQTVQTTYTFEGYSQNITVMPNEDMTITANWTVTEKYYYTVSFDLRWYLVMGCTAGSDMKDKPAPIDSFKVLEGTVVDLTQYAPTCTAYLTAFHIDPKSFKATSWGTSAWGDYTTGGSGFTSITITADTTLYACWERI